MSLPLLFRFRSDVVKEEAGEEERRPQPPLPTCHSHWPLYVVWDQQDRLCLGARAWVPPPCHARSSSSLLVLVREGGEEVGWRRGVSL